MWHLCWPTTVSKFRQNISLHDLFRDPTESQKTAAKKKHSIAAERNKFSEALISVYVALYWM
jgi:hypothetical protein